MSKPTNVMEMERATRIAIERENIERTIEQKKANSSIKEKTDPLLTSQYNNFLNKHNDTDNLETVQVGKANHAINTLNASKKIDDALNKSQAEHLNVQDDELQKILYGADPKNSRP